MITPLLRPDLFGGLATHAGDALFEVCYARDFAAGGACAARPLRRLLRAFWADFRSRPPGPRQPYDELLVNTYAMCAAYSPNEDGSVELPFDLETGELEPGGLGALAALRSGRARARARTSETLRDLRAIWIDSGRTTSTTSTSARPRSTARCSQPGSLPDRVHFELFPGTHRGSDLALPALARPSWSTALSSTSVVRLARSRTCGRARACSSCAGAT